jgi:hypothetical protein
VAPLAEAYTTISITPVGKSRPHPVGGSKRYLQDRHRCNDAKPGLSWPKQPLPRGRGFRNGFRWNLHPDPRGEVRIDRSSRGLGSRSLYQNKGPNAPVVQPGDEGPPPLPRIAP